MKFSHNLNQISLSRTSQLSPHYESTLMAKAANERLAENLTLGGLFKQKAHCSGKRSSPFWKFQFDSLRRKTALLVNEGRKRGFGALVRRRQSWCKIHWKAAACPDAVKLGHPADIPVRPRLFWCLMHVTAWTLATHTGLFESFKTNWLGVLGQFVSSLYKFIWTKESTSQSRSWANKKM